MTRNEPGGRGSADRGSGTGWIDAGDQLGGGTGLFITDRSGGVSPAPYDTLNLAFHTGDDHENVIANRLQVARRIGVGGERFIFMEQVHGLRVTRVGREHIEKGSGIYRASLPATDGVITTVRGVVLSVLTADCVPVAIAEPRARVVALLHAGWRGTIGDIVGIAVKRMREEDALDPADARAVLGPAIAPCCYDVDEGRAGLFVERYGEGSGVLGGREGRGLDLLRANILNLIGAGLREENIVTVEGCTCCDERYFSYRRDRVTGRQGTFLYLQE